MSNKYLAFFARVWMPALIACLLVLNVLAVKNLILFSSDLLHGDRSADQLSPRPIIHPLRVPVRPITQARQAVGRVGSDFAQVYFPAQDISRMQDAFDPQATLDPWKRPSRYAPLVILACSVTFCRLDFGTACWLEMLFQTLLFYAILYWAFWLLRLRRYFLPSVLFSNLCLFVTPVGLSWLERGQFTLYLGSAYVLLMLALIKKDALLMAAAALLAFIKWTSFPPVFVILAVYLLSSGSPAELISNLRLVAVFAAVIAALLLLPALFTGGAATFVTGLITQEAGDLPKGISLLRYAPRVVVKLMPLLVLPLGYLNSRINPGRFAALIPFAAGVVIIMLLYPTLAYEYGLPSALGFLPLLVYWASHEESDRSFLRPVVVFGFFLFIATVSFSTRLVPSLFILVEIYLVFSLILILSPFLLVLPEYVAQHPVWTAHKP